MTTCKRDRIVSRLSMLCVLAGLPPLAWWSMTAIEFEAAVRRRCGS